MTISIVSNSVVLDIDEIVDMLSDSIITHLMSDEQFQLDLKEGTYTFDVPALCDLAEEQVEQLLSNPVSAKLISKLEELTQSKDTSFDWEFENENDDD